MSKQEIIVCAAIRYKSQCAVRDEPTTITILGIDHDHAIESTIAGYAETLIRIEIGFMTNRKRFVTPFEAMKIAVANDQLRILNENNIKSSELLEEGYTEITINSTEKIVVKLFGELKPKDLY